MKIPKLSIDRANQRVYVWFERRKRYLEGSPGSAEANRAYRNFLSAHVFPKMEAGQSVAELVNFQRVTVAQLFEQFLDFARGYYKPGRGGGQFENFRRLFGQLFPLYGSLLAREFGPAALRHFRDCLLEPDEDGGRLSRNYVNAQIDRLRFVFRWGASHQLFPSSVHADLVTVPRLRKGKSLARDPEPTGPASDADVDATLPYLPPLLAAMVQVHRLVGCRSDELCQLQPADIERLESGAWLYSLDDHKTAWRGKHKLILIGPRAQAILAPWLEGIGPTEYVFSPRRVMAWRRESRRAARKTPLTPSQLRRQRSADLSRFAERYDDSTYRQAVVYAIRAANKAARKAAAEAGQPLDSDSVGHWHPHQLRHSLATRARASAGLEASKALLGNTIEATEIYAERDFALAQRIAIELG